MYTAHSMYLECLDKISRVNFEHKSKQKLRKNIYREMSVFECN
jgi:hypothetical protein